MMDFLDDDDKIDAFITKYSKSGSPFVITEKKTRTGMAKGTRSVKYAGPGHTIVTYPNRVLDIKFTETTDHYEKRMASMRRARAKKAAKAPRKPPIQNIKSDGSDDYYYKKQTTSGRRRRPQQPRKRRISVT